MAEPESHDAEAGSDADQTTELVRIYQTVAAGLRAAGAFDLNAMGQAIDELTEDPPDGPAAEGRRLLEAARVAFSAVASQLSGGAGSFASSAQQLQAIDDVLAQPVKDEIIRKAASDLRPSVQMWAQMANGSAMIARGDLAGGIQLIDQLMQGPQVDKSVATLQPNLLFVTAAAARAQGGVDAARPLLQRAAASSEQLATLYYQDDPEQREYVTGQAAYYRAVLTWWEALAALPRLAFDAIPDEVAIVRQADKAVAHLEKSGDRFGNAEFLAVARVLRGLLAATGGLGRVMRAVLESSFQVKDIEGLTQSRAIVREMKETALGPWRAECQSLEDTITNVIKLHRPKRKDFGIVSGIVACVLFVALFAVIALIDLAFDLDLSPLVMLTYAAPLALIGGFGFGALRLAKMLPGGGSRESEAD